MLNVDVILKINKGIVMTESERFGVVFKVSKWAMTLALFFSTLKIPECLHISMCFRLQNACYT